MRPTGPWPAALLAAALLSVPGCGDGGDGAPPERADRPAEPPRGWRTVANRRAGFTIAAPRSWTARTRDGATLIRSADRLVVVTLASDRTRSGREMPAARYARLTIDRLPGFEGRVSPRPRRVPGTPYRTARVDGAGTLRTSRRPQRITVAAYHRPARVTYAAVVFRNARFTTLFDDAVVNRMLRTFRAGPPA